jgi:nucleoside-diphosphate-sugar epimerase
MLADGAGLRAVVTPEVKGAAHAWAFLPNLAETIAPLADREASLPAEAQFHFAGHRLTGQAMAEAVQRVAGGSLPIKPFNWLPIYFAAPFVTFCREVIEMCYLWPTALQLDNARLVGVLGSEPHTKLDEAVRASITAPRSARRPVWPFRTQVIGSSSEPSGQTR